MRGSVPDALVLVVDDDARNRKLVCDVLLAAELRTIVAETAQEAVVLAAEHLPDVILMDLSLPDMDGTEAARILGDEARTAANVAARSVERATGAWTERAVPPRKNRVSTRTSVGSAGAAGRAT